jgi:hypothetical protein
MYTDPHPRPIPPTVTLSPLQTFSPSDVVLNNQEAWLVLAYFFSHPGVREADLTAKDISFAQALLVEAIDESYGIGFLWPNREIYLSKQMTQLAINFLKRTGGNWNWAAVSTSIITGLQNHGGLHYLVRDKMSMTYFINWTYRTITNQPAPSETLKESLANIRP